MLGCRGPLQTYRSSRRQKQQHPDIVLGCVKVILDFDNVPGREAIKWRLASRSLTAGIEIYRRREDHDRHERAENVFTFHGLTANKPAAAFAITCGKKIERNTKSADTHNNVEAITLGRPWHFFTRHA